ncbi:hypothetical protein ABK040_001152 [Willaertia magna]
MGNQLDKDYTISEQPFASGGPNFLWKIHSGTHKQTRQEVSVFCCNIKDIETLYGKNGVPLVIQQLKHEVHVLQSYRHPLILSYHQFFENKYQIAMITEPVLGSISNLILRNFEHVSDPSPNMKSYQLSKVELKYGMCQVMEALSFLHQNAKLTHAGLHPNNIFINTEGHWKVAGFQFSFSTNSVVNNTSSPTLSTANDTTIIPFRKGFTKKDFLPSLDYTAPEYCLEKSPCPASDIFSFALIYLQLILGKNTSILETDQNLNNYTKNISKLQEIIKDLRVSNEIKESLITSCSLKPQERPTSPFILTNCELLFGNEVRALRYLANLEMREPVKKAQFFTSLTQMLKPPKPTQLSNNGTVNNENDEEGFSNRILFNRVLPPLLKECMNPKMILYVLPCIFALSERMNVKEFSKLVLPTLSKYVLMQTAPPKIPLRLLESFFLMWDKSSDEDHLTCLLPFIIRCLDSKFPDIQNEAMKRCDECLNTERITYQEFKSTLLPPIQLICHNTTNQSVRINGIVCLGKILPRVDVDVIVNIIIPVLESSLAPLFVADRQGIPQLPAALLMTCVGVYLKICKQLQREVITDEANHLGKIIATRIIPSISPIAMQTSLNRDQFSKYMKALKTMIEMMEGLREEMFLKESGVPVDSINNNIPQDVNISPISTPQSTTTFKSSSKSLIVDPTQNPIQQLLKDVPQAPLNGNDKIFFQDEDEKEKLEKLKEEEERKRLEEEEKLRIQNESKKQFESLLDRYLVTPIRAPVEEPKPILPKVTSSDIDFSKFEQKFANLGDDEEDEEEDFKSSPRNMNTSSLNNNVTTTTTTKQPSPITSPVVTRLSSPLDNPPMNTFTSKPVDLAPPVVQHEKGSFDYMLQNMKGFEEDDEEDEKPTFTQPPKTSPTITNNTNTSSFNFMHDDNYSPPSIPSPVASVKPFTTTTKGIGETDFDKLLSHHMDSDDEF